MKDKNINTPEALNDDELEKVSGGVVGNEVGRVAYTEVRFECSKDAGHKFSKYFPPHIMPEDYHAVCPKCGARGVRM